MGEVSREIRLVSRPDGTPAKENFALVEIQLPELRPGEVRVRNQVMSVDPYMRGRMSAGRSYVAPFEIGSVLEGGAVGEVVDSESDAYDIGDIVLHHAGWRDQAILPAAAVTRIDTRVAPASAHLGILGMTGLTAYVGLTRIGELRTGDTVFVSAAAGAVGSAAGQIARNLGAGRVLGSAGSAAKVRHLVNDLGYDAAFDYNDGNISDQLRRLAPDGLDVYFDNVGGEHLDAAIENSNDFARLVLCGAISAYNGDQKAGGLENMGSAVSRRLKLEGFIVYDHDDLRSEYVERATGWLSAGTLTYQETWIDGLDRATDAFLALFAGQNTGKMLVRLDG